MALAPFEFQVNRDDLRQHRLNPRPRPARLEDGQALLRIERFALSPQNLAYGRLGPALPFWQLFPVPAPWGHLPVWGFAQVAASGHPDLAVGERVYGCLPMSQWLVVQPDDVDDQQFVDRTPHRQALPALYNAYVRTGADPTYRVASEDQQMLLQPAFATAFVFEQFLAAQDFFDARQVVLAGASSKAATAVAYLLRHERRTDRRIVGLTSTLHRRFVQGTGYFDEVVDYPRLTAMSPGVPTALIDLSGDVSLASTLQQHFGGSIRFACQPVPAAVELLDEDFAGRATTARESSFTATRFGSPDWRALVEGLDLVALRSAMADAWHRFVVDCAYWLRIDEHLGAPALVRVYDSLLGDRADPARGHVILPGDRSPL